MPSSFPVTTYLNFILGQFHDNVICSKGFEMRVAHRDAFKLTLETKKKKNLESTGHIDNTICLLGYLLKVAVA